MEKLSKVINKIDRLDSLSSKDNWFVKLSPLGKLFITVLFITLTVSFSKYDLSGLSAMFLFPLFIFITADLSIKECLWRLKVLLPLIVLAGAVNPFFESDLRHGLLSMATLSVKGILSVLAVYILIASTSIEKICSALNFIFVPKVITTQLLLIYRYITVLLEELYKTTQAYSLRAPGHKGIHFRVWGSFAGQLLLRTFDRSQSIYESMSLRGCNETFFLEEPVKGKSLVLSILYVLFFSAGIILCRVFPVIKIAGGLLK